MAKQRDRNLSDLTPTLAEYILWHAYIYLQQQNTTGLSTEAMRLIRYKLDHEFAYLYENDIKSNN